MLGSSRFYHECTFNKVGVTDFLYAIEGRSNATTNAVPYLSRVSTRPFGLVGSSMYMFRWHLHISTHPTPILAYESQAPTGANLEQYSMCWHSFKRRLGQLSSLFRTRPPPLCSKGTVNIHKPPHQCSCKYLKSLLHLFLLLESGYPCRSLCRQPLQIHSSPRR